MLPREATSSRPRAETAAAAGGERVAMTPWWLWRFAHAERATAAEVDIRNRTQTKDDQVLHPALLLLFNFQNAA